VLYRQPGPEPTKFPRSPTPGLSLLEPLRAPEEPSVAWGTACGRHWAGNSDEMQQAAEGLMLSVE
jgi:hypothetical protein